jgi:hypothetical protein
MSREEDHRAAIAKALETIYEPLPPDLRYTLLTNYIQGELGISHLIELLEQYKQAGAGQLLPHFVRCEPVFCPRVQEKPTT